MQPTDSKSTKSGDGTPSQSIVATDSGDYYKCKLYCT